MDYPYGDFVTVIKNAAGKSFALIGVANEKDVVSIKKNCDPNAPIEDGDINIILKCSPDLIEVFRNQYNAVIPGYYTNKNHWNTVILGKDVPNEEILKMISQSFDLVTGKKKQEGRQMPKATTGTGLIEAANDNFDKLFKIIDSMTAEQQAADFCFDADTLTAKDNAGHWKRDKNLRDVLVHLYEWHQLLLAWERANLGGESKPFLQPPYTWKTYMEMNIGFWQKHQQLNWSVSESKTKLQQTHKAAIELISRHTDEELFSKAFYNWTGTSSLGQYCHSATVAHYDWAMKKLKEQIKALKI